MDRQSPETNGKIKQTKTQINSHTHTHKKKRQEKKGRMKRGTKKRVIRPINKPLGASLVAQMVKHLPATWETQVHSLGQEDPLEM